MQRKKLIVVGNGMAGTKCVEEILRLAPERFDITIFGAEAYPNYNRILLSKVLQGEHALQDIILNYWSWYEQHGIRLLAGHPVHHINTKHRYVETASGVRETYDALILATGSSPFIPPIPGTDKEGVMSFRTIDDCEKMSEMSKVYRKAAVIGGGLLGLEAARGLLHLGMESRVVHNAPYIMNRQLDRVAADMLQRELESQGMQFHLAKNTTRIVGRTRAQGLRFKDGTRLDADVVVLAVGIRPNIELAQRSGILTRRAIVVDDFMRTSDPNIFAVGECAEHRGVSYGLVAPLSIPSSQLKVSGVDVFSAGMISGEGVETAIQHYDAVCGTYKKITMHNGKITGAILYGDTAEGTALLGFVKRGAEISELLPREDAASPVEAAVEAMADHETVCACNRVSKAAILQAITDHGLKSAEAVKAHTQASGSCGGCRPMVAGIVQYMQSGKARAKSKTTVGTPTEAPICDCTVHGHSSLKQAMAHAVKHGCRSVPEIMSDLGWRKSGGCTICLPVIRFYLEMACAVNDDEWTAASKTHNQVSYAGHTFYQGVRIWVDDREASEPVAAGIRHIGEWLRISWQDVTLPYPVSAGVSHGPGAFIGILVLGIGITASPAGWEVYLGGHAEHPVREGQLIGVAECEKDVVQLVSACLQWYRQNGFYDEPLWAWVERTGVMAIREVVLDDEMQRELAAKLSRRSSKVQVG